mmetsp:Transcript_27270/g.41790  ORF Transcript_27270/g.41790 Transcript_27270/m.41790 type:complete len:652 (-) Transcript_27270:203-2158(-)|eukprot:CAMPEP_0194095050 /NCGR_PEP_ID=MMETSP0149-20130528/56626_1 /TAXON_ID=122233 /ORGANISM="Chaetoceros debilis, Strain MM31A-1" /LENGTH=651 /DNA_ID=CAMNT_0038780981 /DNA_START=266 /DNA_END=2218 /DNA_ORIENTATION=-
MGHELSTLSSSNLHHKYGRSFRKKTASTTTTHALSVLALLYLSSSGETFVSIIPGAVSTHVYEAPKYHHQPRFPNAAFTLPSPLKLGGSSRNNSKSQSMPVASSSTRKNNISVNANRSATKRGAGRHRRLQVRARIRMSPQSCFHFLSEPNDNNNTSQTNGNFSTPSNSSTSINLQPYSSSRLSSNSVVYDSGEDGYLNGDGKGALLNRIINGRHSSSPRWRRRTRRAAAALGVPRNYKDEQAFRDVMEISMEEQHDKQREQIRMRERYTKELMAMRPVPALSSSILNNFNQEEYDNVVGNDQKESLDMQIKNHRDPVNQKSLKSLSSSRSSERRQPRPKLTEEQHTRAKIDWAAKYTSIQNLRLSFGSNRNKLWGDFDAKTTRKLYHTLLPRALLGLYEVGLWSPEDLAPLAFEARLAAKKYARERCHLPGRLAAQVYDGFRSWKTWGTWSIEGMTWDQIWHKYETQIVEEYLEDNEDEDRYEKMDFDLLQEEITAQICLRILERSCNTNSALDALLLEDEEETSSISRKRWKRRNTERELARIKIKLDKDMEELKQLQLLNSASNKDEESTRKRAAIFAISSPIFFLDIMGDGFGMGSGVALSPQNFAKSANRQNCLLDDLDSNLNNSAEDIPIVDIVRNLVFPDLFEW